MEKGLWMCLAFLGWPCSKRFALLWVVFDIFKRAGGRAGWCLLKRENMN